MWWGYCELRNGKVGVRCCYCGGSFLLSFSELELLETRPPSPWYLHIPLRSTHKEATLSPDQTRLFSHKFWFLSPDTKLSPGKGLELSPKLCDFCAALIQWLVLWPWDIRDNLEPLRSENPTDMVKWFRQKVLKCKIWQRQYSIVSQSSKNLSRVRGAGRPGFLEKKSSNLVFWPVQTMLVNHFVSKWRDFCTDPLTTIWYRVKRQSHGNF